MKNITTLILALGMTLSALASVSPAEKNALVKLYNNTNGAQWSNKWDMKAPVEKWYGVKVLNDKVVGIDLSNNNLTGELPKEIGNLTSLQSLNLFRNNISGNLPASIGNLKFLKTMNLAFNKLTGPIPAAVGNMVGLQSLELYMNRISGTLPSEIGNLAS